MSGTEINWPMGLSALVFCIALCRLKLHIMRVSPSHPEHYRVCRNPTCPCGGRRP